MGLFLNMGNSVSGTSTSTAIDPIIEVHVKNGKDTDRVLGIISSKERQSRIAVSYQFKCDVAIKAVLFVFKKGCTEEDVWDYIADYIGKLVRENDELIVRTNYWNRGLEYCFTKELQGNIPGHIKRLVKFMMQGEIVYVVS
jgi:hypothetical protein